MRRKFLVLKPLINGPAIYQISCTETDKVYIGESLNVSSRICKHFAILRKNKHHNQILQNIFNKYGENTFKIDILKYYNFEKSISKKERIRILKEDERLFQENSINPCISMDKNCYAWNENVSEEQIKNNKEQLDSIRHLAIDKCSKRIIVYNITTGEKIELPSIKDATKYIEIKHLHRNVEDKIYLPYKSTYVAFYPDEFDPKLILNTKCKNRAGVSGTYILYDLKNQIKKYFGSKTQFSLYFSDKRNDKLYDKYETFIDNDFLTAKKIQSMGDFWNSDFVVYKTTRSCCICNIKKYLELLKTSKTNSELAIGLNINRHSVPNIFKNKTKEEIIKELEDTAGHLPNLFKNWETSSL